MSTPAKPAVIQPDTYKSRLRSWPLLILLLVTVCLLALRFWHISADFPSYHFYSQDHAKFTDEGFYTSAALHYYTLGHAYIPGGWNPGVFMPVWPLMVGLLFHFTGISVAAARSVAVVCTILTFVLAYAVTRQYRSQRFAYLTAFLIATNALGFFFGRLALLEPAFVMFLLLAIYLAGQARSGRYGVPIAVGLVFTLLTLTKTTGLFLLPTILYPIWVKNKDNHKAAWKLLATASITAFLLLGGARWIWVHRYATDYGIIFYLNPLWRLSEVPPRLLRFFFRGTWIDPVLFPLALVCFFAALSRLRSLWKNPLFTLAFLWEAGYATFISFHLDGPPRYFVVLIVPTIWLALIFIDWLWKNYRKIGVAAVSCIALSVIGNVAAIGNYLMHPQYTLVNASLGIKHSIAFQKKIQPGLSSLLIGRGADQVSLLSGGLPTIDSDGAMPLSRKLQVYQPGWYMSWTTDPPLRSTIVTSHRRMVERGSFLGLNPTNGGGILLYQIYTEGLH